MSELRDFKKNAIFTLDGLRNELLFSSISFQLAFEEQRMLSYLFPSSNYSSLEDRIKCNEEGHILSDLRTYPTTNIDGSGTIPCYYKVCERCGVVVHEQNIVSDTSKLK